MNVFNIVRTRYPIPLILNSLAFTLVCYFSVLYIGSYFQPTVYPLIDRVTYSTPFVDKYYINQFIDSVIIIGSTLLWFSLSIKSNLKFLIILSFGLPLIVAITFDIFQLSYVAAVMALPIMLLLILSNILRKRKFLMINKRLYLQTIGLGGLVLGISSTVITFIPIIQPSVELPPINHLYYIHLLFSIFSSILLPFVCFYHPLQWIIKKVKLISQKINLEHEKIVILGPVKKKGKTQIFYLLIVISFSIFLISLPHFSNLNPSSQLIGSDSKDYANLLVPLYESENFMEFLGNAFVFQSSGDRPISLIFLFLFTKIINSIDLTNSIEYFPLVLGPVLVVCIYLLTFELTSNPKTSILASFLTITSFQLGIGTYAGFYANWFSLIFGYLAIIFLIKSLKGTSVQNLICFSGLLVLVLLTHAPTWTILSICIILFLIVNLKLNPVHKRRSAYLFFAIGPSLAIDLIRMITLNSSGVLSDISFAQSQGAGIQAITSAWDTLLNTTQISLAGQIGNPIIYLLILYWLFHSQQYKNFNSIFIVFFSLPILPILFGNVDILTRVLYEIPFQIPAAMALIMVKEKYGSPLFILICLWLVVISIRTFSNFYYINL